tara:strand:- start:385 stop:1155 length:771 start_codon:yes stop_codon:yes gene_type:complete
MDTKLETMEVVDERRKSSRKIKKKYIDGIDCFFIGQNNKKVSKSDNKSNKKKKVSKSDNKSNKKISRKRKRTNKSSEKKKITEEEQLFKSLHKNSERILKDKLKGHTIINSTYLRNTLNKFVSNPNYHEDDDHILWTSENSKKNTSKTYTIKHMYDINGHRIIYCNCGALYNNPVRTHCKHIKNYYFDKYCNVLVEDIISSSRNKKKKLNTVSKISDKLGIELVKFINKLHLSKKDDTFKNNNISEELINKSITQK